MCYNDYMNMYMYTYPPSNDKGIIYEVLHRHNSTGTVEQIGCLEQFVDRMLYDGGGKMVVAEHVCHNVGYWVL